MFRSVNDFGEDALRSAVIAAARERSIQTESIVTSISATCAALLGLGLFG